jgi:hypothetical protein
LICGVEESEKPVAGEAAHTERCMSSHGFKVSSFAGGDTQY